MATPILNPSAFTTGEAAPALFGNVALARLHSAASTMRNFFVGYQGGAYSRAGTSFVGFSKQTGRAFPPRMIPFQFSINQGLALEFGNFYMRVVFNGAFVSDVQANITGVSQTNPAVIGFNGSGFAAASATPVDTAVSASYAPSDLVTLIGPAITQTVLSVTNTKLLNLSVQNPGGGGPTTSYAPGNTINLAGGTQTTTAVLTVGTTRVTGASIVNGGSSTLPPANYEVVGTTGTGTKFQAFVQITGGRIFQIFSINFGGSYTVNPSNLASEPVALAGLTGAVLAIEMGVGSFTITNAGVFTANPTGGTLTQASSSGAGLGATFNNAILGPNAVAVTIPGVYFTYPPNPVAQSSTTGAGAGATFNVTTTGVSITPFSNGDSVTLSGIVGPTAIDGGTYVLQNVTSNSAQLFDVYGNPVNGAGFPAYVSGGLASRIYTLTTIYAEQDLPWLKFTQSADVMSLCCVNQISGVEYPPQDMARIADDDWTFTPAVPVPSISPPASLSGSASTSGDANYAYQVTAVSPVDGSESIASPIANIISAVDITATAGTITLTWAGVAGVNEYNVYKAYPNISSGFVPAGSLFGFAGSAYGLQFQDSSIVADYTQVPPTHQNPFAQGQILDAPILTSTGTVTAVSFTITSANGSGAVLAGVIVGTALEAIIVETPGQNYEPGDTVAITVTGGGSATASLTVGPETGTYPGVVAYFQQRRAYAYTLNEPDTYFMSQPGSFTNFDFRIPTIDSDAITGTPWSVEVNGIQFMVEVTGGLMVLTGLEAYFVAGTGSSPFQATPLTPASQSAIPQGFNGCSPTVPPVRIYQDVLYLQAKGTTYRDFSFQISQYTYTGEDITQNSTQLFNGFTIKEHAWCEEPYRVFWAVRSDGVLLSLTWVKPEKVAGWARHDTNGLFQSVCSVTEPPVDALYTAVQRTIGGNLTYTVERMDNRLWNTVEDAWCVDCGLSLPMTSPNATLSASSAAGLGSLTGITGLVGGQNYSAATFAEVIDDNGTGPGSGAVFVPTIVGGVITGGAFTSGGTGYVNPQISFVDPAGSAGGSGASARSVLNNTMTFTASAAVFSAGSVGQVIRMGGGVATVTAFTDSQHVTANITTPIVAVQSDTTSTVIPQVAGSWTISAPVTVVGGLAPLNGATVTGLADGVVIPPTVVANGQITLGTAASQVTLGMGFHARLQSVYLDAGEPTVQARRGLIADMTARVINSGAFTMGENQLDGSTLSPVQVAPPWPGMVPAPITTQAAYNSVTVPLCSDDIHIPINTGYSKHKQVCVEQKLPLPLNVLAFVPNYLDGDTPSQAWPQKQKGQ
jgi:hypothetical protein